MPTIRVMSWNVENFGQSKFLSKKGAALIPIKGVNYIIDYITSVVAAYNIDVLGIMEMRSSYGSSVGIEIVSCLSGNWDYELSSRQQASRQEEALYIFKSEPNINISPNVSQGIAPVSLLNTIDDNSMSPLFTSRKPDQQWTNSQVYAALLSSGYIRVDFKKSAGNAYRVVPDKWKELSNNGSIDFGKTSGNKSRNPGLDNDQMEILKNILLNTDIILFPNKSERSPFLLSMNIESVPGTFKQLYISMLHCPGPPKSTAESTIKSCVVLPAIANMALCTPLINADNLLMMGDFNISKEVQKAAVYKGYGTVQVKGEWVFGPDSYSFKRPVDFFSVLTNAPLSVSDLMGNLVDTSLSPRKMAKVDRSEYKVNPYDKFFFKSKKGDFTDKDSTNITTARAVDLIQVMDFYNFGQPFFNENISKCGMKFLRSRFTQKELTNTLEGLNVGVKRKREERELLESKKKKYEFSAKQTTTCNAKSKRVAIAQTNIQLTDKQIEEIEEDIKELDVLIQQFKMTTYKMPVGTASAFVVYRLISDHLPISVELTVS
jgi:hypothetical protein